MYSRIAVKLVVICLSLSAAAEEISLSQLNGKFQLKQAVEGSCFQNIEVKSNASGWIVSEVSLSTNLQFKTASNVNVGMELKTQEPIRIYRNSSSEENLEREVTTSDNSIYQTEMTAENKPEGKYDPKANVDYGQVILKSKFISLVKDDESLHFELVVSEQGKVKEKHVCEYGIKNETGL